MLIELRVENHRSLRDEVVLTMEAGRVGDDSDPRAREVPGHSARLLTAAALYGANASGKSNVLAALGFMRDAVLHSHRMWPPEGGVPRAPFAWGARAAQPSLFEVEFLVSGVRHNYGFVTNDDGFLEEWLWAWPHGRKQIWLEREGESFKFGEHLGGENRVVQQVTRPNALFLSTAAQLRHEQLAPLYRWFEAMQTVNVGGRNRSAHSLLLAERWLRRTGSTGDGPVAQVSRLDPNPRLERYEAFVDMLRAADVGIVDLKLEGEVEEGDSFAIRRRAQILVQHSSTAPDAWLPLDEESEGTKTLFRVGPTVLDALWRGGVLLVDELEASLHPLLALQIVRQFNDPRTNPHHAQILFTTHDTNLLGTTLGETALRRDQVWLTEKDKEGATHLYPLTDFKPRKAENLERGYLQGRYGAIPFLGDLARLGE